MSSFAILSSSSSFLHLLLLLLLSFFLFFFGVCWKKKNPLLVLGVWRGDDSNEEGAGWGCPSGFIEVTHKVFPTPTKSARHPRSIGSTNSLFNFFFPSSRKCIQCGGYTGVIPQEELETQDDKIDSVPDEMAKATGWRRWEREDAISRVCDFTSTSSMSFPSLLRCSDPPRRYFFLYFASQAGLPTGLCMRCQESAKTWQANNSDTRRVVRMPRQPRQSRGRRLLCC